MKIRDIILYLILFRYIMICCYKPLFCPYTTPDEEEDLMIQGKIRSLNWVTAAHLECPFKETAPEVRLRLFENDHSCWRYCTAPNDLFSISTVTYKSSYRCAM